MKSGDFVEEDFWIEVPVGYDDDKIKEIILNEHPNISDVYVTEIEKGE